MNSIEERIAQLPKIEINYDDSFLVEIKNKDVKVANVVISIQSLSYDHGSKQSEVEIIAFDPFHDRINAKAHHLFIKEIELI